MAEREGEFRQMAFLFDQRACIACGSCQIACKDLHDLPVGVNWRRVLIRETGQYPNPRVNHISMSCNHCGNPQCLRVCPTGAIAKREQDGIVTLDPSLCSGCRACMDACPYDAPQYDPATGLTSKCDLCLELLARGHQPACVSACPMRALHAGWLDEMTVSEAPPGDHLLDATALRPSIRVIPSSTK